MPLRGADARHRRVEVVEGLRHDPGHDLVDVAADEDGLRGHDAAAGLAHGREHGLHVERHERAQVDDVALDALAGQRLGGRERVEHGRTPGHDGGVAALARDARLADGHEQVRVLGDLAARRRRGPGSRRTAPGRRERMADFSRPLASAAVAGIDDHQPGRVREEATRATGSAGRRSPCRRPPTRG